MEETLKVKIIADTSDVEAKVKQVKAQTAVNGTTKEEATQLTGIKKTLSDITSMITGKLSGGLGGIMTQLGTTAAITSKISKVSKTTTDTIARLAHSSKATASEYLTNLGQEELKKSGMSAEQIKEYMAGLEKFKKSGNMASIATKKLEEVSKGTTKSLKLFSAAAIASITALVLLTRAITKLVAETAKLGNTIDKNSQRLNMTVEQYQKWDLILNLCGSSAENLNEIMNQVYSKLSAATTGSTEAAAAFENLGVSIYDTDGQLRSSSAIFEDTVYALQEVEDETTRLTLANKVFGEQASKLAPIFNMSKEQMDEANRSAKALGATMSSKLTSASAEYEKSLYVLKQTWQGFKNALGEGFMPMLQAIVYKLTVALGYVTAFTKAIFGIKSSPLESLADSAEDTKTQTNKAVESMKNLKRQALGFDEMNILGDTSSSGSFDISNELGKTQAAFSSILKPADLAGLEKFQKKMDSIADEAPKWAKTISILAGLLLLVFGLLSVNIPMIAGGIALAGLGIGIGSSGIEGFGETLEKIMDVIVKVADVIIAVVSSVISFITARVVYIIESFRNWGETIYRIIKGTIDTIIQTFNSLVAAGKQIFGGFKNFFVGIFTLDFKKAIEGLKDIFSGTFNAIVTIVKFPINLIIGFINTMVQGVVGGVNVVIRALNKLSFTVPDWIPGIGGQQWGFNLGELRAPQIPKLATGGIATSSTIANIGENGKEAILPLENNTEWMDMLAQRLGGDTIIEVDGVELGRASVKGINKLTRQTGKLQLQFV